MLGLLTVQKCAKKLTAFPVLYVQLPQHDNVMLSHNEDERYKSSASQNAGSTSTVFRHIPVYSSLAPSKFANDNLYRFMDIIADIHFYKDKVPLQTSQDGSKRLATLIKDQGLSGLCFDLCFPHMYIGWRDILIKSELLEQVYRVPLLKSNNVPLPQKQMAVLLNCFKCRINLEIGRYAEAYWCCDLAEKDGTSLAESWITGVFYYTKVLVELQKSKFHSNRAESLGRALVIFKKSYQGFKKDAGLNFCFKYYSLSAEILMLCIETDKLLHSVDELDIICQQAHSLQQIFKEKMQHVKNLTVVSESYFQYDSMYWHKTLESMREYIQKDIKLLDMIQAPEGKLKDLRHCAMAYISVLIKHPNHERAQSNALFPGLQNAFQVQETTPREHEQTEMNTERECNSNSMDSMSDINDLSSENPDVTGSNSE